MIHLFEIILGTTLYSSLYPWIDKEIGIVINISVPKAKHHCPLNQWASKSFEKATAGAQEEFSGLWGPGRAAFPKEPAFPNTQTLLPTHHPLGIQPLLSLESHWSDSEPKCTRGDRRHLNSSPEETNFFPQSKLLRREEKKGKDVCSEVGNSPSPNTFFWKSLNYRTTFESYIDDKWPQHNIELLLINSVAK